MLNLIAQQALTSSTDIDWCTVFFLCVGPSTQALYRGSVRGLAEIGDEANLDAKALIQAWPTQKAVPAAR